jgi:hypothetical protein
MTMAVKITRDLAIMTSCMDLSVRTVTKSLKVGPLPIFSICLVLPEPGGVGSGASSSWLPKERFRLLAYDYMCKTLQKKLHFWQNCIEGTGPRDRIKKLAKNL